MLVLLQQGSYLASMVKRGHTKEGLAALIGRIREDWHGFKASRAGYRFRDHHRRRKRRNKGKFIFRKVLFIFGGLAIAVVSLVLAPLPGPGLGTSLVGLLIIAGELLIVARFLDWAEVKLRRPARRAKGAWTNLPQRAKIVLGVGLWLGGTTYGLWVLLYVFR